MKNINIFFWNIHGFHNHAFNSSLCEYLSQYDIIGICETWVYNDLERVKSWLSKHTCYAKRGLRNSRFGRFSGGLAVYVKNKSIVIKELKTESKLGIFLLLDKSSLDQTKMFYFVVYTFNQNTQIFIIFLLVIMEY